MVKKMSKGFQCPESGLLHFYDRKAESLNNDDDCFNALSRTHFISTVAKENIMLKNRMFQCPKSGSLHFYEDEENGSKNDDEFQCPKSGSLHFYRKMSERIIGEKVCFNALSRAHFISTAKADTLNDLPSVCFNALSRAHFISTLLFQILAKIKGFQLQF